MADLYYHIRILIPIPIRTSNQMVTLYYEELFTQQGVVFRFQAQLPTTVMGSESGLEWETGSVNVNEPEEIRTCFSTSCRTLDKNWSRFPRKPPIDALLLLDEFFASGTFSESLSSESWPRGIITGLCCGSCKIKAKFSSIFAESKTGCCCTGSRLKWAKSCKRKLLLAVSGTQRTNLIALNIIWSIFRSHFNNWSHFFVLCRFSHGR